MDICEQIASVEAIDLAIKYARRINNRALADKLESIANMKEKNNEKVDENSYNFTNNDDFNINVEVDEEIDDISLPVIKKPDVEIKPLSMSQTLKRINPFLKSGNSPLSPKGKENYTFFNF